MKGQKKEMKVILTVCGREMTFTKQKLEEILEEYFEGEPEMKVPIENRWFKVDPKTIKEELFQDVRQDSAQEETRQLILEAFKAVKDNPEKYGATFETLMPKMNWKDEKTVANIEKMATEMGDHNANWVEMALEWAQRICNGETWEGLCNDADRAQHFRLVIWKENEAKSIGGSVSNGFALPATSVFYQTYYHKDYVYNTVPLVVRYTDE